MSEGFRADRAGLELTASSLRDAASALDEAASTTPPAVDAGVSSARVGGMLAEVVRGLATAAHNFDGAAAGVHATSGAYGDVENTNSGELRYEFGYGEGPGDSVPDDPRMILPPASERPHPVGGLAPEPTVAPPQQPYNPGAGPGGYLNDDE